MHGILQARILEWVARGVFLLLDPPPGDLPDPGIEPTSPAFAGGLFTAESLGNSSTVSVVASGQEP